MSITDTGWLNVTLVLKWPVYYLSHKCNVSYQIRIYGLRFSSQFWTWFNIKSILGQHDSRLLLSPSPACRKISMGLSSETGEGTAPCFPWWEVGIACWGKGACPRQENDMRGPKWWKLLWTLSVVLRLPSGRSLLGKIQTLWPTSLSLAWPISGHRKLKVKADLEVATIWFLLFLWVRHSSALPHTLTTRNLASSLGERRKHTLPYLPQVLGVEAW